MYVCIYANYNRRVAMIGCVKKGDAGRVDKGTYNIPFPRGFP